MSSGTSDAPVAEFEERAAFSKGMTGAAVSAGAGVFVSAVQNSIQPHTAGAAGVFTRTGSTIALMTAMGGVFAFADSTTANIRQKDDAINGAAGGCAAGLVLGAAARSVPFMAGSCAGLAALIGTFDAAGKSLTGTGPRGAPSAYQTSDDAHGSVGTLREEREKRREKFFKPRKTGEEVEEG